MALNDRHRLNAASRARLSPADIGKLPMTDAPPLAEGLDVPAGFPGAVASTPGASFRTGRRLGWLALAMAVVLVAVLALQ